MTTSDGNIVGTTRILDNGPAAQRWNIVIVGDGYLSNELGIFATDAQNFLNQLHATRPFGQVWNGINIYRVDVVSTDSGADDPTACGGTGASPRTYFDASFCNNGIQRLLVVDSTTAMNVADQNVPEWDMIMVIVNSSIYGGSGGGVAVFSTAANASEIGLHEMGHTAFGFADEYEYYVGCGSGETGHDTYTGGEPSQPNITIDTNRTTNKWRSLISNSTVLPTTSNSDCTRCDPQPSPVPSNTVGAFEGADYCHCGAYRPQFNCRMRALNNPFCAVCQQVILQKLLPFVPPTANITVDTTCLPDAQLRIDVTGTNFTPNNNIQIESVPRDLVNVILEYVASAVTDSNGRFQTSFTAPDIGANAAILLMVIDDNGIAGHGVYEGGCI